MQAVPNVSHYKIAIIFQYAGDGTDYLVVESGPGINGGYSVLFQHFHSCVLVLEVGELLVVEQEQEQNRDEAQVADDSHISALYKSAHEFLYTPPRSNNFQQLFHTTQNCDFSAVRYRCASSERDNTVDQPKSALQSIFNFGFRV